MLVDLSVKGFKYHQVIDYLIMQFMKSGSLSRGGYIMFISCLISLLALLPLNASAESSSSATSGIDSGVGYYQIDSVPEGAEVLMDGQFKGETPITIPVYSTVPPGHTVVLSLAGFLPWTGSFRTNPLPGEVVPILADLQPINPSGSLLVTSSPTGSLVTVDGDRGQMTPWTYTNLPPGDHLVSVFLSGYQTFTTTVAVPPGGFATIHADLPTLSNAGVLQVISTPGGADVYVDQVFAGITATTIGNLQDGNHKVRLRLTGYEDWTGDVQIQGGKTTTITPTLVPISQASTGDIRVSSTPPGGSVYLDGVFQGLTPHSEHLELTQITPGVHLISIQLPNYQDYQDTVQVNASQIIVLSPVLTPATQPSGNGSMQINSQPSGADVYLDDQYRGFTPLTLPEVPAGNHTVMIRLTGYNEYDQTIPVVPMQDILISASLSTQVIPTKSGLVPVSLVVALISIGLLMKRK